MESLVFKTQSERNIGKQRRSRSCGNYLNFGCTDFTCRYTDPGRNLHLYIEYIEGEKFPKNKLYTRYTQEHGQLKLSKKGK